jgi:hypothetical protein
VARDIRRVDLERLAGPQGRSSRRQLRTLRTYTHPYFLFISAYSLLVALWVRPRPEGVGLDKNVVSANVSTNLHFARRLFGRHWLG